MHPPTENAKGLTLIGLLGVIVTVLVSKGCQMDVQCLGCIKIDGEQATIAEVLPSVPSTPKGAEAPTSQVRASDNSLVDCGEFIFTPPNPMKRFTPNEANSAKEMVGKMALHITRQRIYINSYEQSLNEQIKKFNDNCK